MKKKSIDSLFADKLQQAEIAPRAEAWAKLQNKMAKKEKKIVWLPFVRWSAAASVALLVGLGVWFMNSPKKQDGVVLAQAKPQTKPVVLESNKVPKATIATIQVIENKIISSKKNTQNPKLKTQNYSAPQSEIAIIETKKDIVAPTERKIEVALPELKLETIAAIEPVSKPEQTVRFELSEPTETLAETIASNTTGNVTSNISKEKRINKIFRQLKNLKNGDDVDWKEVGVKSPKLLARLNRNQD